MLLMKTLLLLVLNYGFKSKKLIIILLKSCGGRINLVDPEFGVGAQQKLKKLRFSFFFVFTAVLK